MEVRNTTVYRSSEKIFEPMTSSDCSSACITVEKFEGDHKKARNEKGGGYPNRFPVSDDKLSWKVAHPQYNPQNFTHPVVLANDSSKKSGGWADPADFSLVKGKQFNSYQVNQVELDESGMPLNPMGRTGIQGRGLLGKYGANFAADPIVWRINPETEELEFMLIQRTDTKEWAIPGGMVDEGESVSLTLAREFNEEASDGRKVDLVEEAIIYKGYCDDPRNTDHAWMETAVAVMHINDPDFSPKAGDDAAHAKWVPANKQHLNNLFASHPQFMRLAIKYLDENGSIAKARNLADALDFAKGA